MAHIRTRQLGSGQRRSKLSAPPLPRFVLERVLKAGSPTIISFSNRRFPTKAVAIWHQLDDKGYMRLVGRYLEEAGNFRDIRSLNRSPRRLFSDPLYAVIGRSAGPYAEIGNHVVRL